MLEIKNFSFSSKKRTMLKDINITVNDGEILAILGPSGSGKSILLRCIMGLMDNYGGTIDVHGAKLGMVFEDFNLFTHLTVVENVMSSMVHIEKKHPQEAYEEAMKQLQSVGMAEEAFSYPDDISGGQKQRVAIARALALDPDIMLFDEPTSNLDPVMIGEIEAVIRQIAASGTTIVMVTSELSLVTDLCDRAIFISDGVIVEDGTPSEIIGDPQREETKRFIRGLQILSFNISSKNYDFLGMQTKIKEYGNHYDVDRDLIKRLQAVTEEMLQTAIIQPKQDTEMHIIVEYDKSERELTAIFTYSGDIDPEDGRNFLSWMLMKRNASEIIHIRISEGRYTDKVIVKMKEN